MDVGSAFGMFAGDLVDRSVRASLLFSSALCFQRVTTACLRSHAACSLHLLLCLTSSVRDLRTQSLGNPHHIAWPPPCIAVPHEVVEEAGTTLAPAIASALALDMSCWRDHGNDQMGLPLPELQDLPPATSRGTLSS